MESVCSLPRFRKECSFCQFSLKLTHNFCPQCGTEVLNDDDNPYDERAVITTYFRKGFEYARIVQMLQKEHGVTMSVRTLKNRLSNYGLKRRNVAYDEALVR